MTQKLKHWIWIGMDVQQTDADWRRAFARMRQAGIDAILPEIAGNSEVAYASDHLPVRGKWLEQVLPLARAAGLEVHAWMHIMPCDIPEIYTAHPQWYAVNAEGASTADKPPYVPYYRFLCPSQAQVQEFLARRIREVAAYVELSGIHLDYIRFPDVILAKELQPKYNLVQDREYPEFDYCYCDLCRRLFQEQSGIDPLELDDPSLDADWRQFRYDRITNLVTEVLAPLVRGAGKQLTAAVFPNWKHVRQEWHRWGLDAALPMLYHSFYGEGLEWIGDHCRQGVARLSSSVPLYSGLFVPSLTPEELAAGARTSLSGGAAGVSLFAAGSMTEAHWEAFASLNRSLGKI